MEAKVGDSCSLEKDLCKDCKSHFMRLRPLVKEIVVSRHFERDVKDKEEADNIVSSILDCSHIEYTEMHKYEGSVDGISVFRAKKGRNHIVYCIDGKMRIVFLRSIRNFDEYKKFIDDRRGIKRMAESA